MIEAPPWACKLDCIDIVRRLVSELGGECILGWALWEWPGVIVEGEFHAIWKRADGTFIDPTPRKDGDSFVIFLPDPKAIVDTWQKDNVRMPLAHRREILDFIDIKERLHRARNRGEEANSRFYTHTPHLDFLLSEEAKNISETCCPIRTSSRPIKNEPNKALHPRRLLVTVRAISSLREGTDCAKQPSG